MVAPLTILLFGPMLVLVEGRPLPRTRSRKALWALALLTLRKGQPVARDWIAGSLWPDAEAAVALANLRPVISELRSALEGQGHRIETPDRKTILINLDGAEVDLFAFDDDLSNDRLDEAVAQFRGPLLEDCTEEWVPQEREIQERKCLSAFGSLAEAAHKRHDAGAAVDYWRRAVAIAPHRDAPRRGLMEALGAAGDYDAALQVYRDFAHTLRSDAGGIPDAQTTDLYMRLRAEGQSRKGAPTPEEPVTPRRSGDLPQPPTELVGREDERLEISRKLRNGRLVTLTGFGGIGKTRLVQAVAAEAASDLPDGAWLVPLESVTDSGLVVPQIARALGLRQPSEQISGRWIVEELRNKRLLLVLDHCDHCIVECARVCQELLRDCGSLRILTTSCEALGVVGERVWPVPTLTFPTPKHLPPQGATLVRVLEGYESVRLFVTRARLVDPTFAFTRENALAVAQICSQLEGIPLAVELAAAQIESMSAETIAGGLKEHHLGLLTFENRSGVARQQTLRSTLDWSYALLDPVERILLERLAVITGLWTREAVEQVAADETVVPEAVTDVLDRLVAKSLILTQIQGGEGRYGMSPSVRQYAREASLRQPG